MTAISICRNAALVGQAKVCKDVKYAEKKLEQCVPKETFLHPSRNKDGITKDGTTYKLPGEQRNYIQKFRKISFTKEPEQDWERPHGSSPPNCCPRKSYL